MTGAATRESDLATALAALRNRLSAAADAAGRDVTDIDLLPITKFFPATDVAILWRLGCRAFGESREQEASAKIAEFGELTGASDVRWHMVGQIQRNKAKAVAAWADTVHSLSSAKVAAALDRGAARAIDDGARTAPVRVFVQISLDGDTSRGGVDIGDPGAVDELCAQVAGSGGLRLVGLMAVPPLGSDPDTAFAALAAEHDRVLHNHPAATELSAGMSGDLEAAVRHGSTCVRVGTALMGQRPLTSP
ncbi:YggS family pyridoxal phosphate-dependent enzyme [Mycobacterium sp. CVI_P3]|uniref:Pyridoxal phosphate homeostasis protein n=1 Tax=Mycobacterium pinniadriaticum TaxID=2994102 RepID=A0ABT3SKU9_9MYCO|nr:YggS family pyridoxal phosphate-dependent enzyme [Mycobacterium pinniadriaticum]MCX2933352.1 YggS family pyridoxal phosphate-dependent enzyme [Mycobacterium pinniadriaticum]MCX2939774.1 YggS family pyridoxal phosphate-dependent enzyme [Mycobacterium pinniadriaticum]